MLSMEEEMPRVQGCSRLAGGGGSEWVHLMPSKPTSAPLLLSQRPGH